jgi:hypothetical protein
LIAIKVLYFVGFCGLEKVTGPLGFFVLDFGPLVKKVGHPWLTSIHYSIQGIKPMTSRL